jgi:hypothetical protein
MLGRMYFNQASVPEHSIDWSCPYVVVGVKSDNNEVAGRHPYVQLSFKILNKGTSRVTIEKTVPGRSLESGLGRYPLSTRNLILFFPAKRVQTHRPIPDSSAPEAVARWEQAPVVI